MTTTNKGKNDTRYFDHERLDAFHVALEALVLGDAIGRGLPRGYGTHSDQLRRALSVRICRRARVRRARALTASADFVWRGPRRARQRLC